METVKFGGSARINIVFANRLMWQKYRKYILKTDWDFDSGMHPSSANLVMTFENSNDVAKICGTIVYLLQMGFEVNSCRWQLNREYLEKQINDEDDPEDLSEREFIDLWAGYQHLGQFPVECEEEENNDNTN